MKVDYDKSKFIPNLPKEIKLSESRKKAFTSLIKAIQAKGVKVIFVMAPEYGLQPTDYIGTSGITFLEEMANKENIPLLNFNTDLRNETFNEDIKNFSDWGHLSEQGSLAFSKKLKESFLEH